ncbi:MAG: DUF1549 domain-containing protein [Verrucomicrobiales bacterium]|nr:DUF1549 domain-containing protein [Verrucomicrobiales bacterium]
MSKTSLISALLILVFLASTALAESVGKLRRWTDLQGRKIEARMVGYTGGLVTLELETGKTVKFPVSKLRERDREYAEAHAPIDLRTASKTIDDMLWAGLKQANLSIKAKQKELIADSEVDPTERNKQLAKLAHMEKMTHPTQRLTDEKFMRRVYLDIGGRIPTYREAQTFLRSRNPNKRNDLIDELIESEAFVSHFFNYMGDLLRIRDGISMEGFNNLKSGAYVDWIKDQIRHDRPWNELVTELLAANGYLWNNPATGYLLTDYGMELCNLSNTFTTFAGTEITCAQCHDHPFEDVYQIDFFRMAAFFGKLEYQAGPELKTIRGINSRKQDFAAAAKKAGQDLNPLNTFLSAYNLSVGDGDTNTVKLPFDYRYDNGEPNGKVNPGVYFGDPVNLEDSGSAREAFAKWMTSESNPRFTINIVNRLWKQVFGIAQIEPVDNIPGHLDGQAQNYELLKYLEKVMKEVDYSLKDFLKVLYKTGTYQREACYTSPTLSMIDRGEFHFPAPILRRMSAEQLWDSFVAMSVDAPEAPERRSRILEEYQEIMNVDWYSMTYTEALERKAKHDKLGGPSMMTTGRNRKVSPTIRASELPLPNRVGSFLYSFGQSDKKFIENSNKDGTIPQVMELLNGSLTNQVMNSESNEMVGIAKSKNSADDGLDVIFLSILSRRATPLDRSYAEPLIQGGDKGAAIDYSDLIWALLNTREFMFIQ